MEMKNVLAIGAHFDDVELGVGGTLAKLSKSGAKVYKLTLTNNVTNFKRLDIKVDEKSSEEYSAEACKILGVEEICNFKRANCNELSYSSFFMQQIEEIIFEYNIDTVFIHFFDDINQDHVSASKLCLTASRYCKNVLMFDSNGYLPINQFSPTVFFDISAEMEDKKRALACYKGDHNRFNKLFDVSIHKNAIYGYSCKCDFAEGFVPIKIFF